MKDHIYRPRRLLSIFGPACLAGRETTGRRFCCGHEATGQTLAMVVRYSGIEFDPARYLADPRPDPVRDADRIVTTRPPRPATKTS